MYSVKTKWVNKMAFDSQVGNHTIRTDTTSPMGDDSGASPKRLLLAGLAGCTGMDVASLLEKMRVSITGFEIDVEADLTEDYPVVFSEVRILYRFFGSNLKREKIEKCLNKNLNKELVDFFLKKIKKPREEKILSYDAVRNFSIGKTVGNNMSPTVLSALSFYVGCAGWRSFRKRNKVGIKEAFLIPDSHEKLDNYDLIPLGAKENNIRKKRDSKIQKKIISESNFNKFVIIVLVIAVIVGVRYGSGLKQNELDLAFNLSKEKPFLKL